MTTEIFEKTKVLDIDTFETIKDVKRSTLKVRGSDL